MRIKVILRDDNNQDVIGSAFDFESEYLPVVGQYLYVSKTETIQVEKVLYVPPFHNMECDFMVAGKLSKF